MLKKFFTAALSVSKSGLFLGILIFLLSFSANAAIRTWNGAGGDNNWSTAANWGGTAPVAGDDLVFAGTTRLTTNNDIAAATSFNSITFNAGAGAFALAGNSITLAGNVVNNSSNLQTINLNLICDAPRTFTTTSESIVIGGDISGSGSVTKAGNTFSLTLSGNNTYSGVTAISAGILKLGSTNALGTSPVAVSSGAVLDLNGITLSTSNSVNLNGTGISNGGALTNTGGDASFSGAITLSGAGSIVTTISGSITLSGNMGGAFTSTFGGTGIGIFSGVKSTAGGLTKIGSGIWTLSGVNTYTGVTTISAGTLSVATIENGGVSGNLGAATNAAANLVLSGGTLQYTGVTASTNRSYTLTAGTNSGIDVTTNTLTISGVSTNTTGALTKTGNGTLLFSGANLYTGITTVNQGTLKYGANNALSSGAVTVNGGIFDIVTFTDAVGAVTLTNGEITGTTGVLTGTSYAMQNGTVSAILGGAVALTKTTTGTVTLSGVNSYTGLTTISAGTLKLGANGGATNTPLGTTGAGTTVTAGAALDLNGFTLGTAEALTLNGTGISNSGALTNTGGNASYSGAITLGSNSTINVTSSGTMSLSGNMGGIFTTTFDGTGNGTYSGIKSTAGALIKTGSGTWTLSGNNTYTGATTISEGTLTLGAADRIAVSQIVMNSGTFRTGATTGFGETVGTLKADASSTITLGTGAHTLTFANSSAVGWSSLALITITGWTGTFDGTTGSAGKIFVGNNISGLTSAQLTQIRFQNGANFHTATILSDGEVVATATHFIEPIEVSATLGITNAVYLNLKAAFDAINAGTHQGAITIKVNGNTTEAAAAVINASGIGSASYSGINIYPTTTGLTITGALAAPLIDLNGADNVTIDGRVNGTGSIKSLTISNTSTAATAGTSTIRFIADATNNVVKFCNLEGSAPNIAGGTIFFSTGTSTGNDNNTIEENTISQAGANLPLIGIYSAGSSSVIDNSSMTISNNHIQDYFNLGVASSGIFIAGFNSNWTITGNKLFQTNTRTSTSAVVHRGIQITSGVAHNISSNIIGFANAEGTGISTYAGAIGHSFRAIELSVGTAAASNVQGNSISGLSIASATAIALPGTFSGISILSGSVNIGTVSGNTIGAATGTTAISVTSTTTVTNISGIYATSTGTVNIQNNIIGGINTGVGSAAIGYIFNGIYTAGTSGNYTISGNTIGSTTTPNSIAVGTSGVTTTGVCTFNGINNAATGTITITGNTVQNTGVYGTAGSSITGIANSGGSGALAITNNAIIGLTNASEGVIIGINNSGAVGTTNINNNIIRNITMHSGSANFTGIISQSAITTALNINYNQLGNADGGLITFPNANSMNIIGISTSAATATCALSVQYNDFRGITHSATASASHWYIANYASPLSLNISNNTFTNLNVNTSGAIYFIWNTGSLTAFGTQDVNNNAIAGSFTRTPTSSASMYLYYNNGNSFAGSVINNNNNNFSNITSNGTGIIFGWSNWNTGPAIKNISGNTFSNWTSGGRITAVNTAGGNDNVFSNTIHTLVSSVGNDVVTGIDISSGVTKNIYRNKIYNLQANNTLQTVNGIRVSGATANLITNIYNNLIGDLKSSSGTGTDLLRGISIISTGATSTHNVYYNTIYLDAPTTSGANLGSSGIYHVTSTTATTSALDLRNNIIVNNSAIKGTGRAVAYRRSTTTLTNYSINSNNNLFYAGIAGADNLLFFDGTNSDQTIAAYKTRMSTRDQASISVNPSFVSTVGADATYLHLANTNCLIKSAGTPISGYTTDFDNDSRHATTPDIGADEFSIAPGQEPATPGIITGTTAQVPNLAGQTYSISAVDNASTYTWTVPSGWTITAGNGTTAITVTTGSIGQNGNITVSAGNGCGNSSVQTLAVTVSVAGIISGNIFEDINYGGGAGRSKTAGSGISQIGARVELYTSTGEFSAFTITDANGNYSFSVSNSGDFYVRVVNSTVSSSRTGYTTSCIPVQTYRTDASTGTAVALTDWVGGTNPTVVDPGNGSAGATLNTSTFVYSAVLTGTAQSVAKVVITNSDINGVDFGFNFNTIVNTNNSGQGSLRQFVTNANLLENTGLAISGQTAGLDVSIFMISNGTAVPGLRAGLTDQLTSGVATINITTALPAISSSGTSIDATTQTANVGNTNPGVVGTGGTVGVDAISLPQYERPEVEVNMTTKVAALTVNGEVSDILIKGFAMYNGTTNIILNGGVGSNKVIRNMLLGTLADGSNPGGILRNYGFGIRGLDGVQGIVEACYIGWNGQSGILGTSNTSEMSVKYCEVFGNGWNSTGHDGIDIDGINSVVQYNLSRDNTTLSGNPIAGAGNGIECGSSLLAGINNVLIENNTVKNNVGAGVNLRAGVNTITVRKNIIYSNNVGILVSREGVATNNHKLTMNSIYSNTNLGIDIAQSAGFGDGVTLNNGTKNIALANYDMDYPVFSVATLNGGMLTVSGYVGSLPDQSLFANARVEIFISENDPSGYGEGKTYLGFLTTDVNGNFSGTMAVTGLIGGDKITGTATDENDNTSEFGLNFEVVECPATPEAITGTVTQSPGLTGQTYSISAVPNATTYNWSVPTGWTITAGSGTTSITVTTGTAGQNGNITVSAQNSCGTSAAASLAVTVTPYQVEVNATLGTLSAEYTTLKAAFDAINAGTHQGAITIKVNGNTTETATAALNASGTGSASYSDINLYPTTTGLSITGALAAPLIDLNGADNVTIDGRVNGNGSTKSLTISNTSTSATAGTSTIRFIADATNNVVKYCNLEGSATNAAGGTIFFSTGTATGNDNNTITENTIAPAGANLPVIGVYSAGTSAVIDNSSITISNNHIQDYFNAALFSKGIDVASNSSTWTISGNRLFQTASRETTGSSIEHTGINIITGDGHAISGNIIGFANGSGTGTMTYTGNGTATPRLMGITLTVGNTTASSVQGNTISGISLTTSSNALPVPGIFSGINVTAGNVATISGNVIGAATGTDAIQITSTTHGASISGITVNSTSNIAIQNNTIGSISTGGGTLIGNYFYGIYSLGTAANRTISSNFIGSASTANSIKIGNASGLPLSTVTGIHNTAGGTTILHENTVQNASVYGINSSFITGIANTPVSGPLAITNNSIIALTNFSNGGITAINNTATADTVNITGNTIRNLVMHSTSGGNFNGIVSSGSITSALNIHNNQLGNADGGLITYPNANSTNLLGISTSNATSSCALSIQNNDIRGITHSATATSTHYYIANYASPLSQNISNNTFTNLSVNTSGTINFINVSGVIPNLGTQDINNNSIVGSFARTASSTNHLYLLNFVGTSSLSNTSVINNTGNNFSNITSYGTGFIYGWVNHNAGTTTKNISGNTFSNWTSQSNITAISTLGGMDNVFSNTIHSLVSSVGTAGQVTGIAVTTGTTKNIYNNKIYNLQANNITTGTVTGIRVFSIGTANLTTNIYNNFIGDLKSSAGSGTDLLRGIYIWSTGLNTSHNVYYNTIYLDAPATSGDNFGSSGIYHVAGTTATTGKLDLRNNIIVNNSAIKGSGTAVAFRRSEGTADMLANYAATSNNNLFFAGTPGASRLIYSDGTSAIQTLAAYKAGVFTAGTIAPRDQVSVSEAPSFLSTTGADANYLHINTAIATAIESGAANIAGFTTDFDAETRQGNPGYSGFGSSPDIGADEFNGVCNAINWTGLVSSDWNNIGNWTCNTLPSTANNVNISAGAPNQPVISAATAFSRTLTLETGSSVTVAGQTLKISGNLVNSGTFNAITGLVEFNGTEAQTTTGLLPVKDLLVSNSTSVTIGDTTSVYNSVDVTNGGTLVSAGFLVIKSNATNTAMVANLSDNGGGNISGDVIVERFISGIGKCENPTAFNRAYRMLAPSVNANTTINANWQEGQTNTSVWGAVTNTKPGFGTQITGAGGAANGFDPTVTNQASLFTLNSLTDSWVAATNTNATILNPFTGYLLFIRGDRSMDMTSAATPLPATNTTLRTKGTILKGTQIFSGLPGHCRNSMITNPFAAPLNWAEIADANPDFENYYTFWDPNIGTRGGYVSVDATGLASAGDATINISSGQAFFVRSKIGTPAMDFAITEANKGSMNNMNVFRTGSAEKFKTGLYFYENSHRILADGTMNVFDNNFSAAVDKNDAVQVPNWDEDIAIKRSDSMLSIERRPLIDNADTLFLSIARLKQKQYELQFDAINFAHPTLQAFLHDKFLGTQTPLNLSGKTVVAFTVTATAASSASDRFSVVFGSSAPLPVTLSGLKAIPKNKGVQVEWNVANEINMEKYIIEHSADGITFKEVGAQKAIGLSTYRFFHENVVHGSNFYRIKSIGK